VVARALGVPLNERLSACRGKRSSSASSSRACAGVRGFHCSIVSSCGSCALIGRTDSSWDPREGAADGVIADAV